jgi:hypothetical protein
MQRKRFAELRRQATSDVDRLRRENAALESRAAPPIFFGEAGGVEEKVRQTFRRFGFDLSFTAACVSLVALSDPRRCDFVARIAKLKAMGGDMVKMLAEFQRDGEWLFYPASSKASIGVTSSWDVTVTKLQELMMNFALDTSTTDLPARGILSVAESLMRGLDGRCELLSAFLDRFERTRVV